jgi:hypothetical protein
MVSVGATGLRITNRKKHIHHSPFTIHVLRFHNFSSMCNSWLSAIRHTECQWLSITSTDTELSSSGWFRRGQGRCRHDCDWHVTNPVTSKIFLPPFFLKPRGFYNFSSPVGFEVLPAVSVKCTDCWGVTPHSSVRARHFRQNITSIFRVELSWLLT